MSSCPSNDLTNGTVDRPVVPPYPSFDDLKITTCTLVVSLRGQINTFSSLWFLPLTKFDYPESKFLMSVKNGDDEFQTDKQGNILYNSKNKKIKKKRKKMSVPHCEPGSIVSARFEGLPRGCLKFHSSFKYSITTDVSVDNKNLNIKLTTEKAHITGAKSIAQGIQGTNILLNILKDLKKKLVFTNDHLPVLKEISDILLEECKKFEKPKQDRFYRQSVVSSNGDIEVTDTDHHNRVFDLIKNKIPFMDDIFKNWLDIETVDNIIQFANMLVLIKPETFEICSDVLEISKVSTVMVNYNYNLGFPILQEELKDVINGQRGFSAQFIRSINHSVNVEKLYSRDNPDIRMKFKKPKHTLICYNSGIITMSGNSSEMMKPVYHDFMDLIMANKDRITNKLYKVKVSKSLSKL